VSREIDVGGGVSYRFVACRHGKRTGAIVSFHDQEPPCDGLIHWCAECATDSRPAWTLHSLSPLHVEPSIACPTHPHHHGWIRGDLWQQA